MKKQILKRMISCIMSLIMVISISSTAIASENVNWNDVKDYYPFSSWAVDTGIKYSFIFLENNRRETTRAEIANIIYNVAQLNDTKNSNVVFSDLDGLNSKQKKSIEQVAASGILKGYENGTFKPLSGVTRAEFVTILDRANLINNKNTEGSSTFHDTKDHWAKNSIEKAASSKIIMGKDDNNFCPEDTITPQEIFIILDRLVSNKSIDKNDLLNSMLDTFKCKVYSDKEKYIAEEMYGKFDEIQNKIVYSWPHEQYYDPTDWQSLATYEDLQYAMFFTHTTYTALREDGKSRDAYNNIIKGTYLMQGLEPNNELYGKNTIQFKHVLRAERCIDLNWRNFNEGYALLKYAVTPKIPYKNIEEFEEYDIISIQHLLSKDRYKDKYYYLVKDYEYLPIDAPVTKYMLNYFIDISRLYNHWYYDKVSQSLNINLESDPSNMPSNYKDYPYIVKGIPKEAYEKPILKSGVKTYTAKDCYIYNYGSEMGSIVNRTDRYFKALVNVDYQNTNFDNYKQNLLNYSYFSHEDEVDEYIQYVKDNQIVIKGTATTIPGSMRIVTPLSYIRVILDFEIVNSNTDKDLLFQDLGHNIRYEGRHFYFVVDVQMTAALSLSTNDWVNYSPLSMPLYENLDISKIAPRDEEWVIK